MFGLAWRTSGVCGRASRLPLRAEFRAVQTASESAYASFKLTAAHSESVEASDADTFCILLFCRTMYPGTSAAPHVREPSSSALWRPRL